MLQQNQSQSPSGINYHIPSAHAKNIFNSTYSYNYPKSSSKGKSSWLNHQSSTPLIQTNHRPKWSNSELSRLKSYQYNIEETLEKECMNKILTKQSNQMTFYKITPKEELPKTLQKMNFQTLNSKQTQGSSLGAYVKIFKKDLEEKQNGENFRGCDMKKVRNKLKKNGEIMLLSQIYQNLNQSLENDKKTQSLIYQKGENDRKNNENSQKKFIQNANSSCPSELLPTMPLNNIVSQLDEWEKKVSVVKKKQQHRFSKIRRASISQQRRNSSQKKQFIVKKFKIGSDYKAEIEKNLQVISYTHTNEQNLVNKYSLIETSSKLLRKQLQEMKEIVQKQIEQKMKKLSQSRKQHHRLYEQKLKLHVEQQELDEEMNKDEIGVLQNLGYSMHSQAQNKMKAVIEDKKIEIQNNQAKIKKIKKMIEFLEEETIKNQEELKSILAAQKTYYLTSLKKGVDCRDTGLVWVIRKLGFTEADLPHIQFPQYLDKKSKSYLLKRALYEDIMDDLMKEKRDFVSQIGKSTQRRTSMRRSSIKIDKISQSKIEDYVKETPDTNKFDDKIHKKYQKSARKITALREQYLQNQGMLRLNVKRGSLQFGKNLDGMTGKQIYEITGQKMKQVDFSKLRKNQLQRGKDKIFEYQSILKEIENLHMELEDHQNHHQLHLLSYYKDQKDLFFSIAAACFGVKRAYALIIKNFSWKNDH